MVNYNIDLILYPLPTLSSSSQIRLLSGISLTNSSFTNFELVFRRGVLVKHLLAFSSHLESSFLKPTNVSSSVNLLPTTLGRVEESLQTKQLQIKGKQLEKLLTEYDRLKLVQAACVPCHGTKCPLSTAFLLSFFSLSLFSPLHLLFSQKRLS